MTSIKIKGMSCNHCVMAVTKALEGIGSVKNIKVDLKKGEAMFDEIGTVDMDTIRKKIKSSGYEVES
ncbi:MAG TPA: cation transporter [Anaerolineae bacterium]|nr:cation transporter [Anaerolineae bacterium]